MTGALGINPTKNHGDFSLKDILIVEKDSPEITQRKIDNLEPKNGPWEDDVSFQLGGRSNPNMFHVWCLYG